MDRGDERTKTRVHWYLARYEYNVARDLQYEAPVKALIHSLACIDLMRPAEDNEMLLGAYQVAYSVYYHRLGDQGKGHRVQ